MAIFLDVHTMPSIDIEKVEELIGSKDEFDVTPINILFNRDADLCYCLQEAPSREAVEKHHSKFNLKCDWITEVTMAKKGNQMEGNEIPKKTIDKLTQNYLGPNCSVQISSKSYSGDCSKYTMKIKFERNKTSSYIVMYSLYLYFLGLSLRNTSKALTIFRDEKRSYVSVWNWIQRFGSSQIYKRKRVPTFIIYETVIQIGNQHFWIWFCIEPVHRAVLGIYISEETNMLIAEKFIRSLVQKYGKHTIYTDGGKWYDDEACNIIGLKHYLHSPLEKSLMERVNQYLKDRIENFDDYYPCMREECNLFHVYDWIQFFVSMYNDTIAYNNNDFELQRVNIILN